MLKKRLITTLVLVAAFIAFLAIPRSLGPATGWVRILQWPLVTMTGGVAAWFGALAQALTNPGRVVALEEEIAQLRAEGAAQTFDRAARAAYAEELAGYDALNAQGTAVPAHVVAADLASGARTFVIATGNVPVPVGAAVLARGALIGVVIEAGSDRALVQLLADPRTRIAVQRADAIGTIGVLGGRSGGIAVTHIPTEARVATGDALVTGLANAHIPDGLPVGTLADIRDDADGFFRTAALDPLVDPAHVAFVTILVP